MSAVPRSAYLTAWGNAWLACTTDLETAATAIVKPHDDVRFESADGAPLAGPAEFLTDLRARGFERLHLILPTTRSEEGEWPPPRVHAAFAGGREESVLATRAGPSVRWTLHETRHPDRERARGRRRRRSSAERFVWLVRWVAERARAPGEDLAPSAERFVWLVRWVAESADGVATPAPPDLSRAAADLERALAENIAALPPGNHWRAYVSGAAAILRGSRDSRAYAMVDLPDGYPTAARTLLAAAIAADNFGGMGSYNDQSFADPAIAERFARAADELYASVLGVYSAAYNAFGAPDRESLLS